MYKDGKVIMSRGNVTDIAIFISDVESLIATKDFGDVSEEEVIAWKKGSADVLRELRERRDLGDRWVDNDPSWVGSDNLADWKIATYSDDELEFEKESE